MKMLLIFAVSASFFASCNTATKNDDATDSTGRASAKMSSAEPVMLPYPVAYSSQFEKSDDRNSQLILGLWKDYDNNTLDNSAGLMADSITMLMPGFEMINVSRDSAMSSTKAYRNTFSKVESRVAAVSALKSTDKNEEWVLVWGTEVHTNKKNVTDSVHLQETWRINKDGKVDLMMQYMRNPPAPKK